MSTLWLGCKVHINWLLAFSLCHVALSVQLIFVTATDSLLFVIQLEILKSPVDNSGTRTRPGDRETFMVDWVCKKTPKQPLFPASAVNHVKVSDRNVDDEEGRMLVKATCRPVTRTGQLTNEVLRLEHMKDRSREKVKPRVRQQSGKEPSRAEHARKQSWHKEETEESVWL